MTDETIEFTGDPAAPAAQSTRDPKPKARARRKKEPSGAEKARKRREREGGVSRETPKPPPSTRELERGLARTLTAPAIPTAILPLPLESKLFLLQHFTTAGPQTAKQLAAAAEQSPELRELLERLNQGNATLTLIVAGAIYLAPVVLWVVGQREAAQVVSMLASADADELAAQAQAAQEQMAMMAAANGGTAQHEGPTGSQHEGPTDPEADAEQAQAG